MQVNAETKQNGDAVFTVMVPGEGRFSFLSKFVAEEFADVIEVYERLAAKQRKAEEVGK